MQKNMILDPRINHYSVAIVEPVGGHGGMNYYDFGLARGLAAAGHNVYLYTCDKTNPPVQGEFKCILSFKGIWGNSNKVLRVLNYIYSTIKTFADISRKNIAIVHFHFFAVGILEGIVFGFAKLLKLKTVITVHDVERFDKTQSNTMTKLLFSKANHIICHNKVSQQELMEKIGIEACMISVIPHGNYSDLIPSVPTKLEAQKDLGLVNRKNIILFFGQIKKVKGLEVLIRAFAKLLNSGVNSTLVIAGKVWKDNFDTYQNLIDELKISDSVVKEIKYISDSDALKYYSAADLVVLPYKKIYQSGVMLMAMTLSKPIVVSNLPGMLEVVTAGENGFIFKSEDEDSLCQALTEAFSSECKLEEVAVNAHQLMMSNYSWSRIGQQTSVVYQNLR